MNKEVVISKYSKRFWLLFFLISILTPVFGQILINFNVSEYITKPLGFIDEFFVLSFFFYSLLKYKSIKLQYFEIVFILFLLVGFFSCLINSVPLHISLLGAFNIVKGIVIYICFKNIKFSTKEILYILNILRYMLPILIISDLIDMIWPDFRSYLSYNAKQVSEMRMGIRSVLGFFTPTNLSFLCNTIFVIYIVYYRKNKIPRYISALMLLLTLKVKDIFGFLMVAYFSSVKRIKNYYVISAIATFLIAFTLYSVLMPEHYGHYFQDEKTGTNARTVTIYTCAQIVIDYFPLGVGFGRFASSTAEQFESPVYAQYRINDVYGLDYSGNYDFINDCFWPMIFGETGFLGCAIYIYLLYLCFGPYLKAYFKNTHNHKYAFVSLVFIFALVCSLAKATLNGPPDSHLIWGFAGIYNQIAFCNNTKYDYFKHYIIHYSFKKEQKLFS